MCHLQYSLKNAINILQYFAIPKSQHRKALLSQKRIPDFVIFVLIVLASIHFDHNLRLDADEVNYISPDGPLPSELHTIKLPVSQSLPEQFLRAGLIPAKSSRKRYEFPSQSALTLILSQRKRNYRSPRTSSLSCFGRGRSGSGPAQLNPCSLSRLGRWSW